MNKLNLDQLAKVCEQATPGPWIEFHANSNGKIIRFYKIPGLDTDDTGQCVWENMRCSDQDFIAHARTALPALLTLVQRIREVAAEGADEGNGYGAAMEEVLGLIEEVCE